MSLGEYLGSGSGVTKGLYHLNGDANDSSGNGNNGTATNVTWVAGNIGNGAASFNGSSSYISMGNVLQFDYNLPLTLSCYFKGDGVADKNIISKQENSGLYRGFGLGTRTGGVLQFFFYGYGSLIASFPSTYSDKLYNIVVTYDGSNNSNGYKFYVDGIPVAVNIVNNDDMSQSIATTASFQFAGRAGVNAVFGGILDEVILEGRVWTPIEIQKQYTAQKGRFGII